MLQFASATVLQLLTSSHISSPTLRCTLLSRSGRIASFEQAQQPQRSILTRPRCHIAALGQEAGLDDDQIVAIFREFDTSGDGFIDVGELQTALSKAGKPVTRAAAQDILERVDENRDGQISLEEFKSVFELTDVPDALRVLTDVSGFFLAGLGRVGDVLGIEVSGQWRSTEYGSRFVDDVLGTGALVVPGDTLRIHYTVTLLSNDKVVESTRGGPPLGFLLEATDAAGAVQGWSDACKGMRVGGRRRVYAKPSEGDGPTARYDIEIVGVEEGSPRSAQENMITALGGRRAAVRLLFAATFVPYFLPDDIKPAFFQDRWDEVGAKKVDKVTQQLEALFAEEERPKPVPMGKAVQN